jgi:hypothetical protein
MNGSFKGVGRGLYLLAALLDEWFPSARGTERCFAACPFVSPLQVLVGEVPVEQLVDHRVREVGAAVLTADGPLGSGKRAASRRSCRTRHGADPEPKQPVGCFDGDGSVMQPDTRRPEPADLLEVERRVSRIGLQKGEGLIGEPLNLGG